MSFEELGQGVLDGRPSAAVALFSGGPCPCGYYKSYARGMQSKAVIGSDSAILLIDAFRSGRLGLF